MGRHVNYVQAQKASKTQTRILVYFADKLLGLSWPYCVRLSPAFCWHVCIKFSSWFFGQFMVASKSRSSRGLLNACHSGSRCPARPFLAVGQRNRAGSSGHRVFRQPFHRPLSLRVFGRVRTLNSAHSVPSVRYMLQDPPHNAPSYYKTVDSTVELDGHASS